MKKLRIKITVGEHAGALAEAIIEKLSRTHTIVNNMAYDKLLDDSDFLDCLRGAGVDNWDGYDIAVEEYQGSR
jgi:hypothetical protein